MRKPDFCISENKEADQLHSNCKADHHLCVRYPDSTVRLPKSEISRVWPGSVTTGQFVSDLVGNPEDQFSRVTAHIAYTF